MYYYTYKITNKVNGHFYIGAHKTSNLNDGYMGSGTALKHAIKKYGADKFEKQILKFHDSQEEMYEHEKELVNADLVLNKKSYNIKLGGHGGFDYVNATNTKEFILERNRKASKVFQEKLKDPEFYKFWYSRMMEGKKRAKNKGHF
ncbi:homing endonuclease [Acinetobacter phage AB-Navy97]|uniref:Putative Seg-like homing endonuclease n=1 Tax=Acinetobacter phage vB_AbaM_Lazarus TaxID=2686289 RepID=A0A6B9SY86_9CAUD|nr:homing endonuclease [Acinetobacter phage vB_AbaM_Lazarus]UJH94928.1 putative Seg-like homing endonuclease [Acinetobacter phage PhaR5]UNI74818.1 homing endonuclease [Acinetobacter phage AB-Navy97]WBF78591.1 putative Seg-like homing endonuclease protein [Acinetobacter phage vB_AbaM_DLP1]CAH1068189.1 group I intron endonuclease [Acinetobacter phage MD-2021a]QHJ74072.1 putative Seg-like homing endonuclease [Acinetobacter phage vB_AbaM_Lazarus]